MDHIQETRPGLKGRKGFPKKVEPELKWEAEEECVKALGRRKHGSTRAPCKSLHCKLALRPKGREQRRVMRSEARDLCGSLNIHLYVNLCKFKQCTFAYSYILYNSYMI